MEPVSDSRIETLAVHAGERRPGPQGSVVFPIYQGTVYAVEPGTDYHDIKYHRLSSTPSQSYLHDKLAALEGAEAALATSSGMAAVTTALLSVMRPGDHLLSSDVLYGGTHDFLTHHAEQLGWTYTFVDPARPETWREARTDRTKYLNGHSDLVAGCVMGSAESVAAVRRTLNHFGGSLDPHAGFLLARGLKTLALRVRAQNVNALAVAQALASHDKVAAVNYPGLASHPDHAYATDLLSGFGGMLSFRPVGGAAAADTVLGAVTLPASAPSLGGVESLITRPVLTSHAGMSPADREKVGVTDDLIRLSCGIEHPDDLVADLTQALDKL